MLGNNDSNPCNRLQVRKDFTRDYSELARHFLNLSAHRCIFICLSPSLEGGTVKGPRPAIPTHRVIQHIVSIAHCVRLTCINIFHALAGRWKLFIRNRIHANAQGQATMAEVCYHAQLEAGAVHPSTRSVRAATLAGGQSLWGLN